MFFCTSHKKHIILFVVFLIYTEQAKEIVGQEGKVRQMGNNTSDENEFDFSPDESIKEQQGEEEQEEEDGDEAENECKKKF